MKTEEEKLVEFFRSPEGQDLGRNGDWRGWTPAETAIAAMKELIHYRSVLADLQKLAILRGEPLTVQVCSPNAPHERAAEGGPLDAVVRGRTTND